MIIAHDIIENDWKKENQLLEIFSQTKLFNIEKNE